MRIREFLKPHVEYEVNKAKINKCRKECSSYFERKEVEDSASLMADFINEAVKLADKHGKDRDEYVEHLLFILSTITATGSFDEYEIMAK